MTIAQLSAALPEALRKLDPRTLWRNPVMFVVEVGAVYATVLTAADPHLFGVLVAITFFPALALGPLAEGL